MSIWRRLGLGKANAGRGDTVRGSLGDTATVRKIVAALDRLDPDRARFIGSFAYLLSRVANADRDVSQVEIDTMEKAVQEFGELPEEHAVLVVQMAKMQNAIFGGTEDYLVTREFKEISSLQERINLLHCIYRIAAADHRITNVEESEIKRIATELGIRHEDLIAARLAHKEFIELFK